MPAPARLHAICTLLKEEVLPFGDKKKLCLVRPPTEPVAVVVSVLVSGAAYLAEVPCGPVEGGGTTRKGAGGKRFLVFVLSPQSTSTIAIFKITAQQPPACVPPR